MGAFTDTELEALHPEAYRAGPVLLGVSAWLLAFVPAVLAPATPAGSFWLVLAGGTSLLCAVSAIVVGLFWLIRGPSRLAGALGLVLGLSMAGNLVVFSYLVSLMP